MSIPGLTALGKQNFSRPHRIGFSAFWATATLFLVSVTWPVWFVWSVQGALPRVSLISEAWAESSQATLVATLASGIFVVCFILNNVLAWKVLGNRSSDRSLRLRNRWERCLWMTIVAAIVVHILLDNLCLQPWVYQTFLFGLIFTFAPHSSAGPWLRRIAISIYFFSAIGKIDFQFVHTVGREMLDASLSLAHVSLDSTSENLKVKLALLFPTSELLLACGLAWKHARRLAAVLAILMHLFLIVLLGPWSLAHSTGVLVWNLALIGQAWCLFLREDWRGIKMKPSERNLKPTEPTRPTEATGPMGAAGWFVARCVLLLALAAPFTERWGLWDHWTSWSLYSPHTSRVSVEIHQASVGKLPETARQYVLPDEDGDRWRVIALEQWALETKAVPIYPQARYQLALVDRLATRYNLGQSIRAIEKSVANRIDGTRSEVRMLGDAEIQERMQYYWVSKSPTSHHK